MFEVEKPLGGKPPLQLLQGQLKLPDPLWFQKIGHELVLPSLLINGDPPPEHHLQAVFELETEA